MEINVRKGRREDLDPIYCLWEEGLCDTYEFICHLFDEEGLKKWQRKLSDCTTYVAEADQQIVGFIAVHGSSIHGIFVHRDYRNIGIGSALMARCKQDYDTLDTHLYCVENRAHRFFERENFIISEAVLETKLQQMEFFMAWNSGMPQESGR